MADDSGNGVLARLVLEDGSVFTGVGFGFLESTVGEVGK